MECEKVQDRFSSLLENTLDPLEEKIVKEHLASCTGCRKDFQQFEKTMQWLHSVREEEVPDGFVNEIRGKIGERKRKVPFFSFPLKPSIQAMAMVAIVFLVLYLTKIAPVPSPPPVQETRQRTTSPLAEKKTGPLVEPQKMEKDRWTVETPHETPGPKDIQQDRVPVSGEEKAKEAEVPPSRTEATPDQTSGSQNAKGIKGLSSEPGSIEKRLVRQEEISTPSEIPEDMTLRFSDREKVLAQLHELVVQFGGKIVTTEGDIVLASLPGASVPEFKKELEGMSAAQATGEGAVKKEMMGRLKAADVPGRRAGGEKAKRPAAPAVERKDQLMVRILLLRE